MENKKIKNYQDEIKRLQRLVAIHKWCDKQSGLVWYDEENDKLNVSLIYESKKPVEYDKVITFIEKHNISNSCGLIKSDIDRKLIMMMLENKEV